MGPGNEFQAEDEMFGPSSSSSGSCSTSSDLTDDEISSPASPETDESLFGVSSLMTHLPVKRGLSNYFSGKSQSFSSLSSVRSVEDLAKKEIPFKRKTMKPSKSYGGVADLSRKAISKKNSRSSCASLASKRNNSGSFCFPKPPLIPLQRNM